MQIQALIGRVKKCLRPGHQRATLPTILFRGIQRNLRLSRAIYIYDLLRLVKVMGYNLRTKCTYVLVFVRADDIRLLPPSIAENLGKYD